MYDLRRVYCSGSSIMCDRLPHAVVERCSHMEVYTAHPNSCAVKHIVQLPQRCAKCIAYTRCTVAGHTARLPHEERKASIICSFDLGGPLRKEFYQGSMIHETRKRYLGGSGGWIILEGTHILRVNGTYDRSENTDTCGQKATLDNLRSLAARGQLSLPARNSPGTLVVVRARRSKTPSLFSSPAG